MTQNQFECELEHQIPQFGRAVFKKESGRRLKLYLRSHLPYQKDYDVELVSRTALWQPDQTVATLARLKTTGTRSLIKTTAALSRRVYLQLQQGLQPGLQFVDEEDGFNRVDIRFSSVNFRTAEDQFNQCIMGLYRFNYYDVRSASVYFGSNQEFPAEGAEDKALKRLLDYYQADKSINKIHIQGFTDSTGNACYNRILSKRRAQYIYDHLVLSGIPEEKIEMEFFGESKAKGKNKKNSSSRRVTVKLVK